MPPTIQELIAAGALREQCDEAVDRVKCLRCGTVCSVAEWEAQGKSCLMCGFNETPTYCCGRCGGEFEAPATSGKHSCQSIAVFKNTGRLVFEADVPPPLPPAKPKPLRRTPPPPPIPPRPIPPRPRPKPVPPLPKPEPLPSPKAKVPGFVLLLVALLAGGVGVHFWRADDANNSKLGAKESGKQKIERQTDAVPSPVDIRGRAAYAEAEQAIDAALKAIVNDKPERFHQAIDKLAQMEKPNRGNGKAAKAKNKQGRTASDAGNFAEAAKKFDEAYQLNPADIEVADNAAYAALRLGLHKHAYEMLIVTLSLAPRRTSAWSELGELKARTGYSPEAIAGYKAHFVLSQNKNKTLTAFNDIKAKERDARVKSALEQALSAIARGFPGKEWVVQASSPAKEAKAAPATTRAATTIPAKHPSLRGEGLQK